MIDEKILKSEQLSEEDLEKVAGGNSDETFSDGLALYRRGLLNWSEFQDSKTVSELFHKMGYKYVYYGGFFKSCGAKDNEYFNKQGESVTREEFWKNFDAENGTQIIR